MNFNLRLVFSFSTVLLGHRKYWTIYFDIWNNSCTCLW